MGSQRKGSQHGTEEGLGGDEVKTGEVSRGRQLRIGSLRMLRHSRHVYGMCKDPKAPPEQGVLDSVVDEERQENVQCWSLGFISRPVVLRPVMFPPSYPGDFANMWRHFCRHNFVYVEVLLASRREKL